MLTALILLPALGAAALLAVRREGTARAVAVGSVAAALALGAVVVLASRPGASIESHRLVERAAWSAAFGVEWFLGADALRAPLAALVALIGLVAVVADREPDRGRTAGVLLLETALLGTVLALDLLLLCAFWIVAVLTTGLLVEERGRAARFLTVNLAGCALMLAALLVVRDRAGTLDLTVLAGADALRAAPVLGTVVFVALLLTFATPAFAAPMVRTPAAPAPVAVLALGAWPVAGALSMLRVALPVIPHAAAGSAAVLAAVGAACVVLGGLRLHARPGIREALAGVTPVHAGLAALGVAVAAAGGPDAATGVVLLTLGFAAGRVLLVMAVDALGDREATGLLRTAPVLGGLVGAATLVVIGFPGTPGFAGTWLVLAESVDRMPLATGVAAAGAVLAASGLLRTAGRVLGHGSRDGSPVADLDATQAWPAAILVALVLGVGLAPGWFAAWISGPLGRLVALLTPIAGGGG